MPGEHIEITDELLKKVKDLASKGASKKEIAHLLEMSRSSLYRKLEESEEFKEAFGGGRADGALELKNVLRKNALGGDNMALIILLKNYSDLKDKHQVESMGEGGGPVQTNYSIEFVNADQGDKDATSSETGEVAND